MFEPEECIGIEATDYLIEQGFTALLNPCMKVLMTSAVME